MDALITVLIILLALYLAGNITFRLMFDSKARRPDINEKGKEEGAEMNDGFPRGWLLNNAEKKDVYIESNDGLRLHADLVRCPESSKWAVILHGYTSNCEYYASYAEHYHQMGYNVLLPDARAHGKSEGRYIGMGWPERLDLLRWCGYITETDAQAAVLLHGMSMGAATALLATGESALPPSVKLAVADSAYSSTGEVMRHSMKSFYHLPAFPLLYLADIVCRMKCGYSFINTGKASEAVKHSHTPSFFVHGAKDHFVPQWMHEKLYSACAAPKQRLLLDEGHIMGRYMQEELYWREIDGFISLYMP